MSRDAIQIRFAEPDDLDWCNWIDHWPGSEAILAHKIEQNEILIAEKGGQRAGYLRVDFLWCVVPYIGMIRVPPFYRRQGIGRALLAFLEEVLRERGCTVLLSSSQVNEPEPQAWHRHMGFEECGILNGINDGGVGEVFFRKPL